MLKVLLSIYSVLLVGTFWHQSEAQSFKKLTPTHDKIGFECTRPNNEVGKCVPLKECQWYLETYKGSIDKKHFWSKYKCTENYDYVCCLANRTKYEASKKIPPMSSKSEVSNKEEPKCNRSPEMVGRCISLNECEKLKNEYKQRDKRQHFWKKYECGGDKTKKVCCLPSEKKRKQGYKAPETPLKQKPKNPTIEEAKPVDILSSGGEKTNMYEFRWIAVLEYKKPKDVSGVLCVGSLINERYVLTSLQCVEGTQIKKYGSLQSVRLGDYNSKTDPDCYSHEGWQICHPSYVRRNIIGYNKNNNGIALLRIDKMVEFTNFVKPIRLPESKRMLEVKMMLNVVGWGNTNTIKSSQSAVILKKRKPSKYHTKGTICADDGIEKNTFKGDFGGPLISDDEVLEGVLSNGNNCGEASDYLSVRFNLEWIKENSDEFTRFCGANFTENRIVGGKKVEENKYSWTVALEYREENTLEVSCGGSLISKRYVLTAAHCVKTNLQSVRLGAENLTSDANIERKDIVKIIIHKKYDYQTDHNDIALLRMNETVQFNEFLGPICLPSSKWRMEPPQNLIVVGWGTTATGSFKKSEVLREVEVPLVPYDDCYRIYNKTDGILCAGGERGKDSCKGDSGGPLMRYEDFWVLEGVTSLAEKCGQAGYSGVYTSVRYYLTWIKDNVYNFDGEEQNPKISYN